MGIEAVTSQPSNMKLERSLTIAAVLWQGLVGSIVIRALVETPAWRKVGAEAWAAFSRQADLGPGAIVYPVSGIVSWVLVLAAAGAYLTRRRTNRVAMIAICVSALFAIIAAATTAVAAPTMIGVGDSSLSATALEGAFARFTLWGVYLRGLAFAISFLGSVSALVALDHRQ